MRRPRIQHGLPAYRPTVLACDGRAHAAECIMTLITETQITTTYMSKKSLARSTRSSLRPALIMCQPRLEVLMMLIILEPYNRPT